MRFSATGPDGLVLAAGQVQTAPVSATTPESFLVDVHTLLRLPTGIFYAQGVRANVLFFEHKPANPNGEANTRKLWDLRPAPTCTSLKENALKRSDLGDSVACYSTKNRNDRKESERFKSFD